MDNKSSKMYFSKKEFWQGIKPYSKVLCLGLIGASMCIDLAFAQEEVINLNKQKLTLSELFKQISTQANFKFYYSNDEVDVNREVKLTGNQGKVSELLRSSLANKYTFKFEGRNIIISPQSNNTSHKNEKQQQVIKLIGRITDQSSKPILGASVVLKGTTSRTMTDFEGKYSLMFPQDSKVVLVYSFVGKKPIEREYKGEATINIVMQDEDQEIEDVVVTGIFDKPRESFTGAVTTISQKELKMFKGQNMLQTLRNVDPSINLVQDNLGGSNPNRIPEINIRGNSSLPMSVQELNQGATAKLNHPLVIMDGFEISIQQLIDLNDDQVQSINIMKDAAATAMYGSRGSNGVIVIITKRPEIGKIRLSLTAGLNLELPDLNSYNLMNALEKVDFDFKMGLYDGNTPTEDLRKKEAYYGLRRDILGGVDTYWLSQPLRTAVGQKYNLKLEGGSQEFRWSAEGNYNESIGVMKNSNRNVFSGAVNLNYEKGQLLFMNRTSYTNSRGNESNFGSFAEYAKMNPYWKIRDEYGDIIERYYHSPTDNYVFSPLYDSQFNNKDYKRSNIITNNFMVDWRPFEGFFLRSKVGLSKTFSNSDKFVSPNSSIFRLGGDLLKKGSYNFGTGESIAMDGSVTANFSKEIAEGHQLFLGLDFSMAHNENYMYQFSMLGYNDRFDFLPNAAGYTENGKPSGSESKARRAGITSNLNYTYRNRYYIDGSFNLDGSSQFGVQKKFAPFWSTGLGWNIHNEGFVNHDIFSQLQLRASYGVTGSQQFASYQGLTTYEYDVNDRYMFSTPAFLMGYGNRDLTWQWTNKTNMGLNFGLFDRMLTGSLDAYVQTTNNMLSQRTIPASTGFTTFSENVGRIKNTGVEMMLSGYPIRNYRNFSWMITGRMAQNTNEILELSPEIKKQTEEYQASNAEMSRLMYEGQSSTSIYAVRSLGIDPSTGQELFYDRDGNITYTWNPNAKIWVGDTEAKYRGNISSLFRYKDLSLNLSFGFHFGGQQYNSTLINRVEIEKRHLNNNVDRRVLEDRWYEPGQIAFYKSFYDLEGNPAGETKASSRFVQNDNMFSLQSASLSYRFNGQWLKRTMGVQGMELSANVADLFYVSTIKRERGLSYPFSRQVFFNWRMTF